MTEIKKGDDAGDHAPKPTSDKTDTSPASSKQDAPNYNHVQDGGSVPVEEMNSANDE